MATTAIPPHVPQALVRDLDIFAMIQPTEDFHEAWHRIAKEEPPVFFTPHYGGYWVINRAELLDQAWPDAELFYSGDGISIPRLPPEIPVSLPIEADGAYHKQLRRPLNMALSPKAVVALSERARKLVVQMIDDLVPKGRCEFIDDFSLKMPMELFLGIVDLPTEHREMLIGFAHDSLKSASLERRREAMGQMQAYLEDWVNKRVAEPGEDFMSAVVTLEVDGRPLNHRERLGYMMTVMFGGLDTVGGTMGLAAKYLATHPEHRLQLAADPSLIPRAIEEILRRHSIPTLSRTVAQDIEFGGAQMRKGDKVMMPTMTHGVDDRKWGDAMDVRLDRDTREHMAFGRGPHRCPGANLARAEIRIFMEEWLKRIPEFSIDPEGEVLFETGTVSGLKRLPLVWPTA